jgi:general secretion pathway protein D
MQQQANAGPPVSLQLAAPPAVQKVGGSFQVAVNLSGGQDIFSVPLQMQYDSLKLSLINVDLGTMLGKDGQAVALVHRDDGSGGVAISASRPPGAAGISGSGSVVLLTFQAKAPGDASIAITRPMLRNSAQQVVPAVGSQAVVHVQ